MKNRIEVPNDILEAIEEVRSTGDINMLDRKGVIDLLVTLGYYKAAVWVEEDKTRYNELIMYGPKRGN